MWQTRTERGLTLSEDSKIKASQGWKSKTALPDCHVKYLCVLRKIPPNSSEGLGNRLQESDIRDVAELATRMD